MSVLGRDAIKSLMAEEKIEDRLIITPLLEDTQISQSSVDIRLGHNFIVTKKGAVPSIDPTLHSNPAEYQAMHRVNLREKFYLHPKELVLAGTLEYFRLPTTVNGYVTSRSSWGRSGLVIATATIIHPGFNGVITLELLNLGDVPMVLYPGLDVAQLVLHQCIGADEYDGRFSNATTTMGSNFTANKIITEFWTKQD